MEGRMVDSAVIATREMTSFFQQSTLKKLMW
jgi:hypothetical protein